MLSSRKSRPLRKTLLAAILTGTAALSSCQVRPLYAIGSQTEASLSSVSFSEAEDRVGQQVRNNLIFMASGGKGEPDKPEYDVDLKIKERNVGVLLEISSDTPRAGRIVLAADFTLKRHNTGEVLKTGHRSAVALVDFPTQQFAAIRATRDGEDRAARELAELITADLAGWLAR